MLNRQLQRKLPQKVDYGPGSQPGLKEAIKQFHEMAQRVPAYGDFLRRNHIDYKKIRTAEDFLHVPLIDKNNYLRQYSLEELCWDGQLASNSMISVSSGSTGEPFFWPHGPEQHQDGVFLHRYIYEKIFGIQDKKTLVVICFSMGTWIAGPYTMLSTLGVSEHHEVLNTITPGIDVQDAARAIKKLHPLYDKLIVTGYPPMVKDVIEEATAIGVDWKKIDASLLFAGETISEAWRDYVLGEIASQDTYHGGVNIYGTVDAAMIGHETPLSILIRRIYDKKPDLMRQIFGVSQTPTLVQYHPELRYLEEIDGEIVFTTRSGLPLCRYNIHDRGKVFRPVDIMGPVNGELTGHRDLPKLREREYWNRLPFASLNGRDDLSITFYGLLIFPENIKAGLISAKLRDLVSGKFVMQTKYDSKMEQYFEIDVELGRSAADTAEAAKIIKHQLIETLGEVNAEYRKLRKSLGKQADPIVKLYKFGNDKFKIKAPKHKWTE